MQGPSKMKRFWRVAGSAAGGASSNDLASRGGGGESCSSCAAELGEERGPFGVGGDQRLGGGGGQSSSSHQKQPLHQQQPLHRIRGTRKGSKRCRPSSGGGEREGSDEGREMEGHVGGSGEGPPVPPLLPRGTVAVVVDRARRGGDALERKAGTGPDTLGIVAGGRSGGGHGAGLLAALSWCTPPPEPPPFESLAHGGPTEWNTNVERWWGKWAKQRAQRALEGRGLPVDPSVDVRTFLRFLEIREGPNGRTIMDCLGPPRDREGGWVSLELVELPEAEAARLEGEGWQTA